MIYNIKRAKAHTFKNMLKECKLGIYLHFQQSNRALQSIPMKCDHNNENNLRLFLRPFSAEMNGTNQPTVRSSRLYGEDPQIYWKSNYHLSLNHNSINFVSVLQLDDKIQQDLLKEHREVVTQELIRLHSHLENYQFLQNSSSLLNSISNDEFVNIFFEELLEFHVFLPEQATQFRARLEQRKDWRRLMVELFHFADRSMYWELSYLYYFSIQLLLKSQSNIKLSSEQLEAQANIFLKDNEDFLKTKLPTFGLIEEIVIQLNKLVYSILLLLNGIFVNKYYVKSQISEYKSMTNKNNRQKKIKLVNYHMRLKKFDNNSGHKRIKTSSNSV